MKKEGKVREGGMVPLAEKEEQHYTMPHPEATPPAIVPFPAHVMVGLALGALAGIVLGVIFGLLLLNNVLVIGGWEAL